VAWVGRYPVPRFARDLAGGRTFDPIEDRVAIDALFERLRSELLEVAPAHEERKEHERQQRGRNALQTLTTLPKTDDQGITVFMADDQPVQPASAVTCVTCHETLMLSPNQPGGFCKCGDFHWYELPYDGSLGRHIPMTEVLHRNEFVHGDEPNSRSSQSGQ
jgi:hypothetical protein